MMTREPALLLCEKNERTLRSSLLSLPFGCSIHLTLSEPWMLEPVMELFEGSLTGSQFVGRRIGSYSLHPGSLQHRRIENSRAPMLTELRLLNTAAGRRQLGRFLAEGETIVRRAVMDGLPILNLIYTSTLTKSSEGRELLGLAEERSITLSIISEGLLAKITTTRPTPAALADIYLPLRDAGSFYKSPDSTLLIAENINNPDNLGMTIRTADAANVDAVALIGEKTDPLHKNCVRASRGAVGRLPILRSSDPESFLLMLKESGFRIAAATGQGEKALHQADLLPPVAVLVGNEQEGLSHNLLSLSTQRICIPMAPGQDSLNVGVAAGVMLYEAWRQRQIE